MPKGYGYDEAPKKASGFKMKGYAYAGDSPMKETPLSIPMIPAQQLPVNPPSSTPVIADKMPPPKQSFGDSFKSAMGTEIGTAVGKAVVEGAVNLTIGALTPKKKQPVKRGGSASGFSSVKIGNS